jgi:hypothetical protein
MNSKRLFWLTSFALVFVLFIASNGRTQQTPPKTKPPVITNTYAVESGQYGYSWRIYIEAEDPDGDMYRIASVVDQTGFGSYPTDWINIKPQYRNHLKGYIQWNTFSSRGPLSEWTRITLTLSIVDKAGNWSNEVVFPFEFVSGVKEQFKLPSPFDQGDLPRLGYISIDLYDPTKDESRDTDFIWPEND